jgi:hypothetical protein
VRISSWVDGGRCGKKDPPAAKCRQPAAHLMVRPTGAGRDAQMVVVRNISAYFLQILIFNFIYLNN